MALLIKIASLIIVSGSLIFYRFTQIPPHFTYDEVDFARLALSLEGKPYIPYSPIATGHATLYFYILLWSMKLFGVNSLALRLPSALFAVGSVVIFYLVLRNVFQKHESMAMLGAFLLATSRWFFNFARFSFEATLLLLLELTSLLFFLSFIKNKKIISLVFSAVFAGLAFNSYTPGRIFFTLPVFFLIVERGNLIKEKFKNIFFIAVFVIFAAPLSFSLINIKDVRFDKQFYLKNANLTIQKKIEFFQKNVISTLSMFYLLGDRNGRHNYPGKPAINPILVGFLLIGTVFALKKIKKLNNQVFFFYFLLSVFPALLTHPSDNPNMLRTYTTLPSIVYFAVYGYERMINAVKKYAFRNAVKLIFLILFFISSFYELRTYFVYQKRVLNDSFDVRIELKKLFPVMKNAKSDDDFYNTIYNKLKLNKK